MAVLRLTGANTGEMPLCAVEARLGARSPKPRGGLNSDDGPFIGELGEDILLFGNTGDDKLERREPPTDPRETALPRDGGALEWPCLLPTLLRCEETTEPTVLVIESCAGSVPEPVVLVDSSAGSGSVSSRLEAGAAADVCHRWGNDVPLRSVCTCTAVALLG